MTATGYMLYRIHTLKVVVHYDLMLSSHMVPCSPAPIHAPTKAVSVPICDCHPFAAWCTSSGENVHQKFWCNGVEAALVQMRTRSAKISALVQKCTR